jgi:hypothetical protein
MAVDVGETNRAEPCQLCLQVEQLVRRVLLDRIHAERGEELRVKRGGRGGDVLEIAEDAARTEQAVHLFIERPLARVRQMVNRKARNNRLECAQRLGQRLIEIVRDHGD